MNKLSDSGRYIDEKGNCRDYKDKNGISIKAGNILCVEKSYEKKITKYIYEVLKFQTNEYNAKEFRVNQLFEYNPCKEKWIICNPDLNPILWIMWWQIYRDIEPIECLKDTRIISSSRRGEEYLHLADIIEKQLGKYLK